MQIRTIRGSHPALFRFPLIPRIRLMPDQKKVFPGKPGAENSQFPVFVVNNPQFYLIMTEADHYHF